ncbi:MAG TPA: CAP domain-containing protein [Armatimonadota bacterium]|jgi:hypothetical protein
MRRLWQRVPTLLALCSLAGSVQAEWAPNDAQQEALEAVNAIRAQMGLPACKIDERLCRAAVAHAAYTDRYRDHHDERPGLEGFTGATPAARARAAGYPNSAGEVINYRLSGMGVTNTVRELFDAPYHRLFWLHGGPTDIGAGICGRTLVIDYWARPVTGAVFYPQDGQKDVPVSWAKGENPDPRRIFHLARVIGYPIVFNWDAWPREEIVVSGAALADAKGQPVDIAVNTPANDPHLEHGSTVVLLPRRPLAPHATYTVNLRATTKAGRDISRTWSFTTGGREIEDRRDSQAEAEMNISFVAEPSGSTGATARILNLDGNRTRRFLVKARNGAGDLLASSRVRVLPSSGATVELSTKEPVQSVVLFSEGTTGEDPVTRVLAVRVRH